MNRNHAVNELKNGVANGGKLKQVKDKAVNAAFAKGILSSRQNSGNGISIICVFVVHLYFSLL